jgi:putative acetyltransferase
MLGLSNVLALIWGRIGDYPQDIGQTEGMMTILIEPGDPYAPGALALLQASHELMQSLFSPDDCHQLSVEQLTTPNVLFLVAKQDNQILGCGAFARRDGYAEIKAMFTDPVVRGRGVAASILGALTDIAQKEEFPVLRLETGHGLDAAIRLYETHGFTSCPPFGSYKASPASLFYEKWIG